MSELDSSESLIEDDKVNIHDFADVSSKAELGKGVCVGSGSVIGPDVIVGPNTWIGPNVTIEGRVNIGSNNKIFPGACIGLEPQDLKYTGDSTSVLIGDNNTFRECITINRATFEGEQTIVGNQNLLMAYSHLGHNCEIGNNIVIANSVQIAGHVCIEDRAVIGGCLGIHQFVHIGYLAMVGGMTRVDRDVPPYCLAEGHPGRMRGLNKVGIKRKSLDKENKEEYIQLKRIWNLLFKSEYVISDGLKIARQENLLESSARLCGFVELSIEKGRRGPMPSLMQAK
ncbi:acyl-ACP--UDP-N-acetylglucosamine O-acyltransferase [Prochlorococcus marinus]|uniref:Acyl-[acyl-carrier-protein]--UDP-N-acetylglucosamine O-acyltransferase n=1 Tax=Prochlorococcus marinus XMU1408 TaxID=2213228 RepID=A0A318R289_PROMR|nr:acyl-ACP--UDP-N-acetylglucosamine O-acyltransferase [Prochlorococcus marinus]MBW3042519.1 acyl-[acyl-carrier-protein]--UDP-N-acetylglucosamine O-acyltransferase [Prochlorococcus marinus str. XMU1408]PYE01247.1 acyl-[acyl-carrier-protein]--UDP-N-acetylglucosamine O-acyltransferase [Prochlorococcus marinus XMU1408]